MAQAKPATQERPPGRQATAQSAMSLEITEIAGFTPTGGKRITVTRMATLKHWRPVGHVTGSARPCRRAPILHRVIRLRGHLSLHKWSGLVYDGGMSSRMTINPARLSDDDWGRVRAFIDSAKQRGEVVDFSTRVELLTPAEVAARLGMSRSTVLRRIADGEIKATKVGTHHRIPLNEYERYSRELIRRMAEASAADIEAELFGE